MVRPGQPHELGPRDAICELATMVDGRERLAGAMEHEGRHSDGGQHVADVDPYRDAHKGAGGPGAVGQALAH